MRVLSLTVLSVRATARLQVCSTRRKARALLRLVDGSASTIPT